MIPVGRSVQNVLQSVVSLVSQPALPSQSQTCQQGAERNRVDAVTNTWNISSSDLAPGRRPTKTVKFSARKKRKESW